VLLVSQLRLDIDYAVFVHNHYPRPLTLRRPGCLFNPAR
jgi:hypothetical protein